MTFHRAVGTETTPPRALLRATWVQTALCWLAGGAIAAVFIVFDVPGSWLNLLVAVAATAALIWWEYRLGRDMVQVPTEIASASEEEVLGYRQGLRDSNRTFRAFWLLVIAHFWSKALAIPVGLYAPVLALLAFAAALWQHHQIDREVDVPVGLSGDAQWYRDLAAKSATVTRNVLLCAGTALAVIGVLSILLD